MKIEVIRAWPRQFTRIELTLPPGARVIDALRAAGLEDVHHAGTCAIFGVAATLDSFLTEGDRIELLRPLETDPKESRRRRAAIHRGSQSNQG